jgi:CSLREA domain-containing protein
VAAAGILLLPASASAQEVTVNSFGDAVAGPCTTEPFGCTLRDALSSTADGTIVRLPAGTYTVSEGPLPGGGNRTLVGAGARTTIITAENGSRVMNVTGGISISGVTITEGRVEELPGGGIHVSATGALNLFDSTVLSNEAETGGGIYSEGTLHVERSTIAENFAIGSTPRGGGVAVVGGDAELRHTTISTNFSQETGGGLYTTANVELHNVTIARNGGAAATPSGGGIQQAFDNVNDLTVAFNTLVVENEGGNCLGTTGDDQIAARFSMADDQLCNVPIAPEFGNTPIGPSTANLGDLQNNGGPTDTHELGAGSPALGEGEPGSCEGGFDQRGLSRDLGGICDVGAYERVTDLSVTREADRSALCTEDNCSLREAVTLVANEGEVDVPAGNYSLSLGELSVERNEVIVRGTGARVTTIAAGAGSRVLSISDGAFVTLIGVRITGGNVLGGQNPFGSVGGGIAAVDAGVSLIDSAVDQNVAGRGGGIFVSNGGLLLTDTTVSRNQALDVEIGAGGGLYVEESSALVSSSTISGNSARTVGGGIITIGSMLNLASVTLAANSISSGQGPGSAMYRVTIPEDTIEIGETVARNTLIAGNSGDADCVGEGPFEATNVVSDHASCRGQVVGDALIGDLAANGGETDTHALLVGSPAIDTGANCGLADQRGVSRPQGVACDVGAYEREATGEAASLRVVTTVVTDNGGTRGPADFNVHVRAGTTDVPGSPQPGSANGTPYTLAPGGYTVSGDATGTGYTVALGGDCSADGSIELDDGDVRQCTVTFDDIAQQPPQGGGGGGAPQGPIVEQEQLPEPEAGEEVNAEVARGTVRVKLPGTSRFVDLDEPQQLPVGTVVDTTKGRITLVAAGGQTATFYDGIFRIGQGKGARPLTTLTLVEALSCPKAGRAVAAAKKKKRRLWGDGSGRFRTKGKHSAATVVGTKWLVEDRCTSTLTRVTQGRVSVRDFVKKKTVTVRAGKKYVARAKRS